MPPPYGLYQCLFPFYLTKFCLSKTGNYRVLQLIEMMNAETKGVDGVIGLDPLAST
jgi:hypothetical protein